MLVVRGTLEVTNKKRERLDFVFYRFIILISNVLLVNDLSGFKKFLTFSQGNKIFKKDEVHFIQVCYLMMQLTSN